MQGVRVPPRKRNLAAVPDVAERAKGEIERNVAETLEKLELQPEDAGLRTLALHYARVIDRAEAIAAQARKIPFDPDSADEVKRLAARVSAQVTASDIGPKLLAVLDALGATPKARSAAGGKGTPPKTAAGSALAAMRGGA